MAASPSHRFGQIIGEILEQATVPLLADFANAHGLYLDKTGPRPCRRGLMCKWKDSKGNSHDLDYVLEKGGTADKIGTPAAFIEAAWRRYTKHSRNKAQEIHGAVGPLVETYRNAGPFMGAILAGVFTEGALAQLRSHGFTVLYFPYASVVRVLGQFGVDAAFDESTPDVEFQLKVGAYERLSSTTRTDLHRALLDAHRADVDGFMASLATVVLRQIERIIVLPLHGTPCDLATVDDAVRFLQRYDDRNGGGALWRYEVLIRYNNGDKIEASFRDKQTAIRHLKGYAPIQPATPYRGSR